MKTVRCRITHGFEDSYGTVAIVEGPSTPSMKSLAKTFAKRFGIPSPKWMTYEEMCERHKDWDAAATRSHSAGYRGDDEYDLRGAFVDWLVKEHGFTRLDTTEFHLEW